MLKRFITLTITPTRNYAARVNIKWTRPEVPSCTSAQRSGDLTPARKIESDEVLPEIKSLPEFQKTNDMVKSLFTVNHLGKNSKLKILSKELCDRVRRHEFDDRSMEVRIAAMTAKIRYQQISMEKFPLDGSRKEALKELIERRNKFLKYMRRWDYKRFEWLLEKLSISFKPLPLDPKHVTRKQALSRLTDIHCEEIKAEKMKEYKAALIIERENLLKEYKDNPLE